MIDIAMLMMNGGTRSQRTPAPVASPTSPQAASTPGSRYHSPGLPAPTQLVARMPPMVIVAGSDRSRPPVRITTPCPKDSTTRKKPSTRTVSTCDHEPRAGLMSRALSSSSTHRIATLTVLTVSRVSLALPRVSPVWVKPVSGVAVLLVAVICGLRGERGRR